MPSSYVVLEKDFNSERIVFESKDQDAADRVAKQHPARRLVERKDNSGKEKL